MAASLTKPTLVTLVRTVLRYQASDGYEDSAPADVKIQVTGTPAGLPSSFPACNYHWKNCEGKAFNAVPEDTNWTAGKCNLCVYEEETEEVGTGTADGPYGTGTWTLATAPPPLKLTELPDNFDFAEFRAEVRKKGGERYSRFHRQEQWQIPSSTRPIQWGVGRLRQWPASNFAGPADSCRSG